MAKQTTKHSSEKGQVQELDRKLVKELIYCNDVRPSESLEIYWSRRQKDETFAIQMLIGRHQIGLF